MGSHDLLGPREDNFSVRPTYVMLWGLDFGIIPSPPIRGSLFRIEGSNENIFIYDNSTSDFFLIFKN